MGGGCGGWGGLPYQGRCPLALSFRTRPLGKFWGKNHRTSTEERCQRGANLRPTGQTLFSYALYITHYRPPWSHRTQKSSLYPPARAAAWAPPVPWSPPPPLPRNATAVNTASWPVIEMMRLQRPTKCASRIKDPSRATWAMPWPCSRSAAPGP